MINKFLAKKIKADNSSESFDPISEVKNWYSDKYESIILQRNILFLIIIFTMITILCCTFIINKISTSKNVIPFIVEIENRTGIATIVNPEDRRGLTADHALNSYFIIKFVKSRETYSQSEFNYNKDVVRLLSSNSVYDDYRKILRDSSTNPSIIYANNSTSLKVRSLIFAKEQKQAQIRFSIIDGLDNKSVRNKIANIDFKFIEMEMSEEERQINPLGFQITSYRVSDENL